MTAISIIYYSGSGITDGVAKLLATGVASVDGIDCHLLRINPKHIIEGRWQDEETLTTRPLKVLSWVVQPIWVASHPNSKHSWIKRLSYGLLASGRTR